MSEMNTPFHRLTQALAEHRFALTAQPGEDVQSQRAALEVIQALVQAELQRVRSEQKG